MTFTFWQIMPDGTAEPATDEREINAGRGEFYGSIEGAIINGGVQACAFERKSERTYCGDTWLKTNRLKPTGTVIITKITAMEGKSVRIYHKQHVDTWELKPHDIYHPHHPLHHMILDEEEMWNEFTPTLKGRRPGEMAVFAHRARGKSMFGASV
ncbi:MAG: hypothetical protein LAT55_13005 [Opitutales bacterium]|nr:hypothetical protein [Opitutales bacterium]